MKTKICLLIISLFLIMSCYPKPPTYRTDYGEECAKHCQYSYVYSKYNSSRSDLKQCYESCTKAEEIRERAFERYKIEDDCPNDCEDK